MGFTVAGLGLLGFALGIWLFKDVLGLEDDWTNIATWIDAVLFKLSLRQVLHHRLNHAAGITVRADRKIQQQNLALPKL